MEGEATSIGEIILGGLIMAGAIYGAMRYAKYKKANRKPSTGGSGGGSGGKGGSGLRPKKK